MVMFRLSQHLVKVRVGDGMQDLNPDLWSQSPVLYTAAMHPDL